MKTITLKAALIIFIALFSSCSKDDDTSENKSITSFENEGSWNCELGETCEDVYQFEFKAGSKISISVEGITGMSVVSLDLAADFGQFGGPNLLTEGDVTYYGCTGQDEDVAVVNIEISETSTYNLALARDWGLSAGFDGTYTLSIISDTSFKDIALPINNTKATNYERECP
ncbi:hypothetical protein [Seonamhaeicola marinus]|uniref:Peptidase C-terminal archaeal/bacterial domain-containing protein n=1 Tax=Seonamhaeicola marinus TaxID=1912246 RepID=A0A5D0I9X9_9FLAO|nr:hypothetical protein [Seonamhaeicola marinus]TYA78562.1 hypothetical protein FUA24_09415 [Seonamhaeicola marinus]